MESSIPEKSPQPEWFAIRTRQDFRAEQVLKPLCEEVFFPKEVVKLPGEKPRYKAIIPRVLFIKTTRENALALERLGRENPGAAIPLWVYRYPGSVEIQVIPQASMNLLHLLTAPDATRCEIFTKTNFRENEHVRITGGIYKGYDGYVQRVKKNKHVIVKIEGICLLMLPYIHPDLLQPID